MILRSARPLGYFVSIATAAVFAVPSNGFAQFADLPVTQITSANLVCSNHGVLYAIDTNSAKARMWQSNASDGIEGLELTAVKVTLVGGTSDHYRIEASLLSVARVELDVVGKTAEGRVVPNDSANPVQVLPTLVCGSRG